MKNKVTKVVDTLVAMGRVKYFKIVEMLINVLLAFSVGNTVWSDFTYAVVNGKLTSITIADMCNWIFLLIFVVRSVTNIDDILKKK